MRLEGGVVVKKYNKLEVKLTKFSQSDVITASGENIEENKNCVWNDISTWGNCFPDFTGEDDIPDCIKDLINNG